MRPSDRPHEHRGVLRRLRRAAVALPLAAAMALGAVTLAAPGASAHGTVTNPETRSYGCWQRWGDDHLNPEMATLDPMCWQAFQDNPNAMWNWNGLLRDGAGGQYETVVPNGQLCSGGLTENGRYRSLDKPGAWKMRNVPNTFTLTLTDSAKHGADFIRVYVSKPGFDPTTEALGWDDIDLVKTTGGYPTSGLYETEVNLPGRSGRAVVFTLWKASHSDQSYYLCSDVNIGGGPEPTQEPTTEPTQEPTTEPTQEPTQGPTQGPTQEPTSGPTGPAGACTATIKVNSTWPGGFIADVNVKAGTSPIKGWKVQVGGATINQAWNGTLSGSSTITSAVWNGSLSAGATATAGFIASGSPGALTATCSAA
jgi:lytic cellulose monooxygenase (C4-dehydrogenating)